MFRDNIEGTVDFFAQYIYPQPALQPEFIVTNISSIPLAAPDIHFIGKDRIYIILHGTTESRVVNRIAIYKLMTSTWNLFKVVPADGVVTNKNVGLELEEGEYVATLIDRFGSESLKRNFKVNADE